MVPPPPAATRRFTACLTFCCAGEMVWTSESCDPGLFGPDETAHITVQGGLHRGDEACPDECTVGEAHGDCMGGEGYCEQELTRGLPTGGCRFDTW